MMYMLALLSLIDLVCFVTHRFEYEACFDECQQYDNESTNAFANAEEYLAKFVGMVERLPSTARTDETSSIDIDRH
jgi:hypothetical protein